MRYPKDSITQNTVVIMWAVLILIAAAVFYLSLSIRYEPEGETPPPAMLELFPESQKSDITPPVIKKTPSAVVEETKPVDNGETAPPPPPPPPPPAF